jgi:hypothetical protein
LEINGFLEKTSKFHGLKTRYSYTIGGNIFPMHLQIWNLKEKLKISRLAIQFPKTTTQPVLIRDFQRRFSYRA